MEQDDEALAAALGGDQRGTIGKRRPGAIAQRGIGLGQHLPADRDIGGHCHAEERALAREGGELLRLIPGQAAAENASAAPKLHRHQVVVAGSKARSCETHQHAAVLEPARERLARVRDIAYVGEDQHWKALLDELADRLGWRAAIGEPHVGERPERACKVVGRGQQRLRGVGGRAGDHADRAPPPAFVE